MRKKNICTAMSVIMPFYHSGFFVFLQNFAKKRVLVYILKGGKSEALVASS